MTPETGAPTTAQAAAPPTFTRMDESTSEEWGVIVTETIAAQPLVADSVLAMLRSLADVTVGFAVDQLTHCLQTATLAERAGADDEWVVASLCHDIGKAVSVPNHPRIASEILRPSWLEEARRGSEVHRACLGLHHFHTLATTPPHH